MAGEDAHNGTLRSEKTVSLSGRGEEFDAYKRQRLEAGTSRVLARSEVKEGTSDANRHLFRAQKRSQAVKDVSCGEARLLPMRTILQPDLHLDSDSDDDSVVQMQVCAHCDAS